MIGVNERKTYVCKRTRMASFLVNKGFQPYRIVPDKDNPLFFVYLFSATPELYSAVMEYTTRNNNIMKEGIQNGR